MAFEIFYKKSVYKDLKQITPQYRAVIMDKISRALSKIPPEGKALTGHLKGLNSYRSGDYRVIYAKTEQGILILRIMHRKEVYKGKV